MPCRMKLSSNKNAKSNLKLKPDNLDYNLYIYTYTKETTFKVE